MCSVSFISAATRASASGNALARTSHSRRSRRSAPLGYHLRVAALPCGGLADVLVRQRDEHAAGHGRGDEARGEVAEVDLEVAERVLGLLLHGGGLVVARGQPRERLLLLRAAREAAQHVVHDVARDVGHARAARAARAGAFVCFVGRV